MATISISSKAANEMPQLMNTLENCVATMQVEFFTMETLATNADTDIYDMDPIATIARNAKEVQVDKFSAICTLSDDIDEFIQLAADKDIELQDEINSMKGEFYKDYPDLRPESEVPWYEKVADWFAENWEIIAIIYVAIVVVALVIIATVVTGGTFAAALGAVLAAGALVGLANVAGTFVSDWIVDRKIDKGWQDYLGSFVGGFITGVFKIICPVPFLGDFIGGFYGSIFTTALTNLTNGDGEDKSFAMGLAKAYGDGFVNGLFGLIDIPNPFGKNNGFVQMDDLMKLDGATLADIMNMDYLATQFAKELFSGIASGLGTGAAPEKIFGNFYENSIAPNIGIYGVSVAIGGPFAIPLATAWGNAAFSDSGVVQSIVAPSSEITNIPRSTSMPVVTVADITIPNFTMPDFSVPSIVMPNISAPTITVPNIAVPAISIAMPVFG